MKKEPALARAAAPHPIWGGEPQSLQVAAELGKTELVALLLDHGADPDARPDAYNWSALHLALNRPRPSRAHRETAELLIARGASVDLWAAAALGDVARARSLIEQDPSRVHARGPSGATPLHFAATPEVALVLLDAGADPEAHAGGGNTPARYSAYYVERRAVTRFLLQRLGQEPDVFLASALGDVERVRALSSAHPELLATHTAPHDGVARLSRGATPLQVAVLNAQPNVVRLLLELGAEVDARSVDGQTALHLAAGNGELELVKLLVEHGADVSAVEAQHGSTPLDWAEFHLQHLNGPASCRDVAEYLRGLA